CMHRISGTASPNQRVTSGRRAAIELTFQVASFKAFGSFRGRLTGPLFENRASFDRKRSYLIAFAGLSGGRVAVATTSPLLVARISVLPEKIGAATISHSLSSLYRLTLRPSAFKNTAT